MSIKFRRGTAAAWTAANPVLASGEPGFETDTKKEKRGDGVTAWGLLGYLTGNAATVNVINDLTTGGIADALSAQQGITLKGQVDSVNSTATAAQSAANAAGTLAALKAPIASPALTGTPTAPTASSAVNTTQLATTAFVQTVVAAAVTGLLDLKTAIDCAASPNYPAASKSDVYLVSVAGKIGGASGKSVDTSDMIVATADNAGGTEAAVGASWVVIEHNLVGAMLSANNLSDLADLATAWTNLGGVERAQDAVAAAFAAGTHTGLTVTYDDTNNRFTFAVTASGAGVQNALSPASTTLAPSVDAVNTALGGKIDAAAQRALVSGETFTRALHVGREQINTTAAATIAFVTAGMSGGDHFYLRNSGAGTFAPTGLATAPAGCKNSAAAGEAFSADFDSVANSWVSTTPDITQAVSTPSTSRLWGGGSPASDFISTFPLGGGNPATAFVRRPIGGGNPANL